MDCIFNELSFCEFVDSPQKLAYAFKELYTFRELVHNYKHNIYIHRIGLYDLTVCGQKFRQAVNIHIRNLDEQRKIFNLLDKSMPRLPDDSAIPTGCDFFHNGQKIPITGLAESAYRQYMDMEEKSLCYSFSCDIYEANPLFVTLVSGTINSSISVSNFSSIQKLKIEFDKIEPAIDSWMDLLQRTNRLQYIRIEMSARESLNKEPFEISLGRTVWERLQMIEEMAASIGNEYIELDKKYCHGKRALFSDESQSRIDTLKDKLYFKVNGEKKLCSFHGKISNRTFRIYMDKKPVPGKIVHITHIGYKIL